MNRIRNTLASLLVSTGMAVGLPLAMPVSAATVESAMIRYELGEVEGAIKDLRQLAEVGDSEAQYRLGLLYHTGATKDFKRALEWYRKAAKGGNAPARNNLGVMYRDGLGTPVNRIFAYMWFNVASGSSTPLATTNRDRLAEQMSGDEILNAQWLSREFRESGGELQAMGATATSAVVSTGTPNDDAINSEEDMSGNLRADEEAVSGHSEIRSSHQATPRSTQASPPSHNYFVQIGVFEEKQRILDSKKKIKRHLSKYIAGKEFQENEHLLEGGPAIGLRIGPFTKSQAQKLSDRINETINLKSSNSYVVKLD